MKKYNFVCVQTIFNERMDTKKLRQKVLDLAIHGKLVPQNPNDEPASVLLERIRAEKERLIAEGKIKRSKKSATSDTSHYENVPEGWCITTIGEVFNLQAGKNISANDIHEFSQEFPYACYGGNGIRGYVSDYNKEGRFPIIGRQGALCGNVNFAEGKFYATEHAVVVTCIAGVNVEWARYVLEAMNLNQYATATAQPGLSVATVNEVEFLLPPLKEQCRIAEFVANCFDAIEALTSQTNNLRLNIDRAKSKILDLAIHGKLVPQDPNDEPASELLKRINPKAVASCDNPHYEQIPDGWCVCTLEDIVDYEQPQAYIVHSTGYSDSYKIPVLTAGKSFIIGYTNEQNGICDNVPVIIFDDFTTDSKYVDFPFKVKSSAMKILHVKEGINIKYVAYFMSITRLIGDTHKRYWISEYSKVNIPLPPKAEQDRIVTQIERLMSSLDSIAESLV